MPSEPKLRGRSGASLGPWPIGEIPRDKILKLGRLLTLHIAKQKLDLTGDEFGELFSKAIGGNHFGSPLGVDDISLDGTAWSAKTIKLKQPKRAKTIRLISGRNSPDFSFDMKELHEDIQATGTAVLRIWNSRLDRVRTLHNDIRFVVLVRNMQTQEFLIFEEEMTRYSPKDYEWSYTKGRNIQAIRKSDGKHCFTWQFSGGQFTIFRDVPGSRILFKINRDIPRLADEFVEQKIEFHEDWIEIE